ncbi:MAG: hypothetical protein JW719_04495 [Pirellulales bacterium]|nr:hypothetical protein [Pirellulales bacterium]
MGLVCGPAGASGFLLDAGPPSAACGGSDDVEAAGKSTGNSILAGAAGVGVSVGFAAGGAAGMVDGAGFSLDSAGANVGANCGDVDDRGDETAGAAGSQQTG